MTRSISTFPSTSFRTQALALQAVGLLPPILQRIERHDRDLSRQLRRAASSVVLNLAEGAGLRGGHRRERWGTALGSARECVAALQVAEALGYVVGGEVAEAQVRFDRVAASTYRLLHGRR